MAEDNERNLDPTPHRLESARKRGNVPYSRDLAAAVTLLAAVAGLHYLGTGMLDQSARLVRSCLEAPGAEVDVSRFQLRLWGLIWSTLKIVGPWLSILVLAGLGGAVAQMGGVTWASEKNWLDLERLNPATGLSRLLSTRTLARTALESGKVGVVGWVVYLFLSGEFATVLNLGALDLPELTHQAFAEAIKLGYWCAGALLVLASIDYLNVNRQYHNDLKMSHAELLEEMRQFDVDPTVKKRQRKLAMQIAQQKMVEKVKDATVVVTNPTALAIAIKYDVETMEAPVVLAKGAGLIAARIRQIATEHRIPILENKPLARLLFRKAAIGKFIPKETFAAVSEILLYVYRLTGRRIG